MNEHAYLLGIDLGGTRCKTAVFSLDGQSRGEGYAEYAMIASQSPPGAKGLVFLPYMSGERTPIWDPYARGVFFGLALGHTWADLFRAMLEGPAFAIRHTIEIVEREIGSPIAEIHIGGAAARGKVWTQIIADALGKPVLALSTSHVEVLGAAVLAGMGVGASPHLEAGIWRVAEPGKRYAPDSEAHAVYDRLFPIYRRLYPSVVPYFRELAELDLPQGWVGAAVAG